MGAAVAVSRSELTPAQLRSAACASEEPAQVRRLLAIALVLEGMPRQQAAEQCGMDRQTLRDWVHRYNEGGVAGLRSRPCPGRAPLLTPEQKAELRALVVAGPDPARDKVVRWRCVDLRAEVARRFGVEVREGTIGGWLHQLGLTRLGIVNFEVSGRNKETGPEWRDDVRARHLPRIPLPGRDHQLRCLAVPRLWPELP